MTRKHFSKDEIVGVLLLVLAVGFCGLAIIDPNSRLAFVELAKMVIGGCIGWMMRR